MDPLFVKAVTDIVVAYAKDKMATTRDRGASDVAWDPTKHEATIAGSIERHIRDIAAWSSRIQFFGMSRAEETDATTIPLRLHAEPRRFRAIATTEEYRNETDLLVDDRNYLLLGDPGAGKTTTLKRLVNYLLTSEPLAEPDDFQFPIVVRLRELPEGGSLIDEVAAIFGIRSSDFKPAAAEWWPAEQRWLGDVRFEFAIAELLRKTKAVLLADGIDEVSLQNRQKIERELELLARNAQGAKIITSCRSGDYVRFLEGFDLMEICPLSQEQISDIARAWLPNAESFSAALSQVPYQDLADRPLLLGQLLFIYKRYGYLPEQPNQIYKKIVSLLLYEWDAERRITRPSKYASFVPERKAAFLSALAYHLTFRARQKTFDSDELRRAYVVIRESFGLPLEQATQVVAELETHTGIIVVAGPFTYEFAHLSLQEYLCAEYLVREPFAEYMSDYLAEYPAPVAVAVSLAAEPSSWFAALVLGDAMLSNEIVHSFLTRLLVERPYFSSSDALGVAVLKLYQQVDTSKTRRLLDRFTEMPGVWVSVGPALRYYTSDQAQDPNNDLIRLRRVASLDSKRGFGTPLAVAVPRLLISRLANRGDGHAINLMGSPLMPE